MAEILEELVQNKGLEGFNFPEFGEKELVVLANIGYDPNSLNEDSGVKNWIDQKYQSVLREGDKIRRRTYNVWNSGNVDKTYKLISPGSAEFNYYNQLLEKNNL